jgi:hypothetical protein
MRLASQTHPAFGAGRILVGAASSREWTALPFLMAEDKTRLPELDPVPATRFTTLPVIHHHEVNDLDKRAHEFEGSKFEREKMPDSGDRLFARGDDDRQGRIGSGWFQETVGNEAIGTKGPEEVVEAGCLAGVWRKNLKPLAPGVDPFSKLTDSDFQAICGDLDEEDLGHGLSPTE